MVLVSILLYILRPKKNTTQPIIRDRRKPEAKVFARPEQGCSLGLERLGLETFLERLVIRAYWSRLGLGMQRLFYIPDTKSMGLNASLDRQGLQVTS